MLRNSLYQIGDQNGFENLPDTLYIGSKLEQRLLGSAVVACTPVDRDVMAIELHINYNPGQINPKYHIITIGMMDAGHNITIGNSKGRLESSGIWT